MTEPSTVEIRRYPNRRLYDRSRRQYVTLQDIEAMVLDGTDIEVRDSRTGEDLTRQVLTQIMMERHPQKMELFPVAMLHNMLRANDLAVEMWRGYLRQALTAVDAWQNAAAPLAGPLGWMSALFPTLAPSPVATPPSAPVPVAEGGAPSDAVTERLARLAERIARLEGGDSGTAVGEPEVDQLESRIEAVEQRRSTLPPQPRTRR